MKIIPSSKEAYQLLHEGSLALAEIEHSGMRVNVKYLDRMLEKYTRKIKEMENELRKTEVYKTWQRRYGQGTKLDSREQLGEVLFNIMKFPCHSWLAGNGTKNTYGSREEAQKAPGAKKVRPQADEISLSEIDLPFTKDFISLSKYKKMAGTYLKGIKDETVNGCLHPVFNLHTVETWRSSSSSPNFQNIPVRNSAVAKIIRKCFVPRKGHQIGEIDFGALEFRIAACFWKDPNMISYASDPKKDVHEDEAASVYMLSKNEVSKDTRYSAKNRFVFPILYGSNYVNCSKHLWECIDKMKLKKKIPDDKEKAGSGQCLKEHLLAKGIKRLGNCIHNEDAVKGTFEYQVKNAEDNFCGRFPLFGQGKIIWWKDYQKNGYFPLMTGFIATGIHSKNFLMNTPIQGPAFHCLLWCLIQLQKWLRKKKMKTRIVGQIHDSIVADIHEKEVQDYFNKAKELMTVAIRNHWKWIVTPLLVEAELAPLGKSWHYKTHYEFT